MPTEILLEKVESLAQHLDKYRTRQKIQKKCREGDIASHKISSIWLIEYQAFVLNLLDILKIDNRVPEYNQPPKLTVLNEKTRIFMREVLIHNFNIEELRTIVFEMNIRHENFSNKLDSFSRELIEYCERQQSVAELIEIIQKKRPQITW